MEISEADREWNEMITLLNSDDPEEQERGKALQADICMKWPEVCRIAQINT